MPAAPISRRTSSAVNTFAPCSARWRRSVFFVGRLNSGPKRTGLTSNSDSKACLNAQRMTWMMVPIRGGPFFLASLFLRAAKSAGARPATGLCLPSPLTIIFMMAS